MRDVSLNPSESSSLPSIENPSQARSTLIESPNRPRSCVVLASIGLSFSGWLLRRRRASHQPLAFGWLFAIMNIRWAVSISLLSARTRSQPASVFFRAKPSIRLQKQVETKGFWANWHLFPGLPVCKLYIDIGFWRLRFPQHPNHFENKEEAKMNRRILLALAAVLSVASTGALADWSPGDVADFRAASCFLRVASSVNGRASSAALLFRSSILTVQESSLSAR